jgi:hypothetical protein
MPKYLLAEIDLPEAKPKSSKKEIPVVPVAGDTVRRYNQAYDAFKEADATMKELRAELITQGLTYIFEHNIAHADSPDAQIQSVRLANMECEPRDNPLHPLAPQAEEPEVLTVTWTKKALKMAKDVVTNWFTTARNKAGNLVNLNRYTEYEVEATFNTAIFYDAKGRFSVNRYNQVVDALKEVAEQLGAEHPLSCSKVLKPTEAAPSLRFQDFNLRQNLALTTVMPTQVTIEPVRMKGVK